MRFLRHSLLAAAAYTCTSVFGSQAALAEPLKIGAMLPLSGPSAATGELYVQALTYVVGRFNKEGGWQGEPVEIEYYDTQGSTGAAADRFQQAIADGMHIIAQGGGSSVAAALSADVMRWNSRHPDQQVLSFSMGAEAADLTGADCHFHHFRFGTTAAIRVKSLLEVMKANDQLGNKVYSINQDYSWGQEMQAAIEANAGPYDYEVVGTSLHATNKLADFSSYALKIKESGADTAITGDWSRDLQLLMKAISQSGVDVKLATVYLDQPGSIAAAGRAAEGSFIAQVFNAEAAGEKGEQYRSDYHAAVGAYPQGLANNGAMSMMMLTEALKTLPKEDDVDVNQIALALEKAVVESWPTGTLKMRAADHQLVLPLVVSRVTDDARFKVDDTRFGFKPVSILSPEEAGVPVQESCKMARPE